MKEKTKQRIVVHVPYENYLRVRRLGLNPQHVVDALLIAAFGPTGNLTRSGYKLLSKLAEDRNRQRYEKEYGVKSKAPRADEPLEDFVL